MLKEARDLCCDQVPNGALATIIEQALVLLIAHRKKQRFALTVRPRKHWIPGSGAQSSARKCGEACVSKGQADGTLNRPQEAERSFAKREETKPGDGSREMRLSAKREETKPDSRYIPSALRREVYARDGGRCSFVSKGGTRCGTRRDLEFHHIVPFAKGGAPTLDNLSLMCRVHNALLAERDYGRDYVKSRVAKRKDQTVRHRTIEPGLERVKTATSDGLCDNDGWTGQPEAQRGRRPAAAALRRIHPDDAIGDHHASIRRTHPIGAAFWTGWKWQPAMSCATTDGRAALAGVQRGRPAAAAL